MEAPATAAPDGSVTLPTITPDVCAFTAAVNNKIPIRVFPKPMRVDSITKGFFLHLAMCFHARFAAWSGTVAGTAMSLDPGSRTMLVEVQVSNKDGALLPGMYARVDLNSTRTDSPIVVPSDVLIVHPDGTLAAMLGPENIVHLRKIEVGRDYGDKLEILNGLKEGDIVIPSAGDNAM
jgi:multidrug efflux pump subunit AcrA (membrane-fusion protein)